MPRVEKRKRYEIKFWLDANKEEENYYISLLDDLKDKRKQKPFLLAALRILTSLQEGRVDWLLHYFPQIEQMLYQSRVEAVARQQMPYGYDESYHR